MSWELRKQANTESHANPRLYSRGECQLKCPIWSNSFTRLRLPHFKLDQWKMIGWLSLELPHRLLITFRDPWNLYFTYFKFLHFAKVTEEWFCGFLFLKVPKFVDDKGSWASMDGRLDWIPFSVAYWGHYMNRFMRKSHKTPQGKNVIPPC